MRYTLDIPGNISGTALFCLDMGENSSLVPNLRTLQLCTSQQTETQENILSGSFSALTYSSSSLPIRLFSLWSFRRDILYISDYMKHCNGIILILARCTNTGKCLCNELQGSVLTSILCKAIWYPIVLYLHLGEFVNKENLSSFR